MPKVNTFNYDTIASWNGSQDLFVVEQPDGTKVATPAMVKQFIEAGDFVATGEVEDGHGNILKDMAKSADVDEVIGDLSQTGLTGDSVSEQLTTAGEQIAAANGQITNINSLLLPLSKVVKRFVIDYPNRTIDTGINVNLGVSIGFIALASSHGSYNAGMMNIYIGGVPLHKQDGSCGDLKVEKLGGIGMGGQTIGDNLSFSVANDTLRISSSQYQGGLRITLILTTSA